MSAFKELRGKRILVTKPVSETKSLIEITPEVQAELDKELMTKWTRLTVFAVGTDVLDIKPNDEVYINASMLANAELVRLDGVDYMMVIDHAVAIVY
jgi:hypothetical protein